MRTDADLRIAGARAVWEHRRCYPEFRIRPNAFTTGAVSLDDIVSSIRAAAIPSIETMTAVGDENPYCYEIDPLLLQKLSDALIFKPCFSSFGRAYRT